MNVLFAFGFGLLVSLLPLAAAAQTTPPAPPAAGGDLSIEKKQKRSIVLPKPSQEQIKSDADRAVNEYAAKQDPRSVVKDTVPVKPSARPDLDYDVRTGIQSQNANKARQGR
jgi:hypothetical protein